MFICFSSAQFAFERLSLVFLRQHEWPSDAAEPEDKYPLGAIVVLILSFGVGVQLFALLLHQLFPWYRLRQLASRSQNVVKVTNLPVDHTAINIPLHIYWNTATLSWSELSFDREHRNVSVLRQKKKERKK